MPLCSCRVVQSIGAGGFVSAQNRERFGEEAIATVDNSSQQALMCCVIVLQERWSFGQGDIVAKMWSKVTDVAFQGAVLSNSPRGYVNTQGHYRRR